MMRILLTLLFLTPAMAAADFYFGLGAGWYNPELTSTNISGLQTADDGTRTTIRLFAGNTFGDGTWAVEGAYEDLDSYSWRTLVGIDSKSTSIEADAISVGLTKHFGSVYGLVGLYRWTADAAINSNVSGNTGSHLSGSNGMYGLGWDIETFNWLDVRLSYTRYMGFGNSDELGFKRDLGMTRVDFKIFIP